MVKMSKKDLVSKALELNIEIPDGASKKEIKELIDAKIL